MLPHGSAAIEGDGPLKKQGAAPSALSAAYLAWRDNPRIVTSVRASKPPDLQHSITACKEHDFMRAAKESPPQKKNVF
jgi:hypothetical protein